METGKVFISYRRDDTAGLSQVIHDRLTEHLRPDQVFMDRQGLAHGADFVAQLQHRVQQCDVLLAVMDRNWAGDAPGRQARICSPQDWVRAEVATALRLGKTVIPVLVNDATMPAAESLPADLQALTRLQACEVRASRLDADAWDLAGTVVTRLGGSWPPAEPGGDVYAALAGLYALWASGAVFLLMLAGLFHEKTPKSLLGGVLCYVLGAVLVLRLPVVPELRLLSRADALLYGAMAHLAGFFLASMGEGKTDIVGVVLFGFGPAAALYLGTFAMQRAVRR